MSDLINTIVLGIIEGLTEFLPVSSTAHLRIAEPLLGIDLGSGYWKMYSVVIQLGAILSVVWLFWRRSVQLWKNFPQGEKGDRNFLTHPLGLIMLSFCVTAPPCYFADKYIGKNLERLTVMGLALIIGGVVMWWVDAVWGRARKAGKTRLELLSAARKVEDASKPHVLDYQAKGSEEVNGGLEGMNVLQSVWIGAVQILSAVFPGTSRSMSTIAAGQVAGLSRSTALEFSFFLSIPTMMAATGYKLLQALAHRPKTPAEIHAYGAPPHQWVILAIGFVVSFLVALVVNAWFINWVRRRGFAPFAVYRILVGLAVLVWALK